MRKAKYADAPPDIEKALEKAVRIKDFLPPPEDLVPREKTVKVTIDLNASSITFFKKRAARLKVPYQQMIRNLLDIYARNYDRAG